MKRVPLKARWQPHRGSSSWVGGGIFSASIATEAAKLPKAHFTNTHSAHS